MAKNPWLKWYPADWRQEPALRLCSRAARSLWVDMICLMHDGEPYGHLTVNGKPLSAKQLAAVLGDSERDVTAWLKELEDNGVLSRADDGTIYSRRMVRDKARDDENRSNGKRGGNPKLTGADKQGVNPQENGGDKAQKLEARSHIPEARDFKVKTKIVAGGFKQIGEGQRIKNPRNADTAMEAFLSSHCGMDAMEARNTVSTARTPEAKGHVEARRFCEKISRDNRLGWFHAEAAE